MSDLSDFFKLVSEEKKKNKQELETLISDSFNDLFVRPLEETVSHKKIKPKKKKILLLKQYINFLAQLSRYSSQHF